MLLDLEAPSKEIACPNKYQPSLLCLTIIANINPYFFEKIER
jgi:hypothetical protein